MHKKLDRFLSILLRQCARENDLVAKEIAAAIGEGPGVVARWLNPNDHYWIRAGALPDLCELLGPKLIECLAHKCGGHFVPFLNVDPERLSDEHYAALVAKFGNLMRDLGEAFDPRGEKGRAVSADEARGIVRDLREVGQLVESLTPFYEALAAKYAQPDFHKEHHALQQLIASRELALARKEIS